MQSQAQPQSLVVPGLFRNTKLARSDADMQREVRAHFDAHPGIRFLVDTLSALHASPLPVRTAKVFYETFPAGVVMTALEHRADLRARVMKALTAGPPSLTRRMSPTVITAQIELLVEHDIPLDERAVRSPEDRSLSVVELYLKYLDPIDLVAYLAPQDLWAYESKGAWWETPTDSTKRLMAAEIKSIRKHAILSDTELLDVVGDDVIERDLPADVRTALRRAARRAAKDKTPFSDTDAFDCIRTPDGSTDLVDSLVASVPLSHLRLLLVRAAEVLGLVPAQAPAVVTGDAEVSLMTSLVPASEPPRAGAAAAGMSPPAASMHKRSDGNAAR